MTHYETGFIDMRLKRRGKLEVLKLKGGVALAEFDQVGGRILAPSNLESQLSETGLFQNAHNHRGVSIQLRHEAVKRCCSDSNQTLHVEQQVVIACGGGHDAAFEKGAWS